MINPTCFTRDSGFFKDQDAKLTPRPEKVWNDFSVVSKLGRETIWSGRSISTLSAYKISLNSSSPFSHPLMSVFVMIALANGSIARAKTSGDRGQPWRVPLLREKYSEEQPGRLIRVLWYRALKAFTNSPENPNLVSTASIYGQRTLSKALCMSKPRIRTLREKRSASWIILDVRRILSVICLVGIKPVCSGPIGQYSA